MAAPPRPSKQGHRSPHHCPWYVSVASDPSSSAPPMSSPAWWQNADLACLGFSFSLQQLLTCSASCLQPQSYQQTLKQSFLLGGVGLHTGEYGELLDCLSLVHFWLDAQQTWQREGVLPCECHSDASLRPKPSQRGCAT